MISILNKIYQTNLTLLTDLYQLTMAYGYWKNGMSEKRAVFHLYYRKNPFKGNYAIACGLELAIGYLQQLHFDEEALSYLQSLKGNDEKPLFEDDFLKYLKDFSFKCDVEAIPEGTVVFPNEPLMRISGPLLQVQLVETALLTIINFSTLIATKASRIRQVAGEDLVLEFGLRRAQGIDGGLSASRAAFIGGCNATSNILAGQLFGIPVKGTHAHSWVMSHSTEMDSFQSYAAAMPNNCIFLVDTYDTIEGVKNAIQVGNELRKNGYEMLGIRLDSGDLAELSIAARKLLDEAGFEKAAIVASNDLDEYRLKMLKEKGAKITVWGIGTRLATAYDQPALGGVYKLAALENDSGGWDYKVKLSEQEIKVSNPGIQQVLRVCNDKSSPIIDYIYDEELGLSNKDLEGEILLEPIFKNGKLVYNIPNINKIQKQTLKQLQRFTPEVLEKHEVHLDEKLVKIKREIINKHK